VRGTADAVAPADGASSLRQPPCRTAAAISGGRMPSGRSAISTPRASPAR
jgi:hypothetical protein